MPNDQLPMTIAKATFIELGIYNTSIPSAVCLSTSIVIHTW